MTSREKIAKIRRTWPDFTMARDGDATIGRCTLGGKPHELAVKGPREACEDMVLDAALQQIAKRVA